MLVYPNYCIVTDKLVHTAVLIPWTVKGLTWNRREEISYEPIQYLPSDLCFAGLTGLYEQLNSSHPLKKLCSFKSP